MNFRRALNFRRTRAVGRKEFLHILRDPLSLAMALAVPLMMLLLFGYALSLDVDRIPTVIYDADRTAQSRDFVARFEGSRFFRIVAYAESDSEIQEAIDRGECLIGVWVPKDFSRELDRDEPSPVQLLVDGSDSNTASIALGYVRGMLGDYSANLRARAIEKRGAGEFQPAVDARIRVWYNPELASKNYIVPGLIAVILMIIAALLTSLTIAREFELGNLELLMSTPLRPAEIVLGKMSAYFILGVADALIAGLVGVFVFDVPLRGDVGELSAVTCLFLFGALSWGLFISALTRSQLVAYQLSIISSFLPAFLLSGFIYSIENMPAVIQAISHIVPARYFVALLKAIFLKGVSVATLPGELLFLALYAALVFFAATRQLHRKLA